MNTITRSIHPEVKVLDEKAGIMEFVASDETVDSFHEVIRADGWRFNLLQKNPVFLADHNYEVKSALGELLEYKVVGRRLVETVRWAIGLGKAFVDETYAMYVNKFLKAVSVGFVPVTFAVPGQPEHSKQMKELNIEAMIDVRTIYTTQEQIELSAVVIGANCNAIALAYKAGVLSDASLQIISLEQAKRETASNATDPAAAVIAERRARDDCWRRIETAVNKLKGKQ
jgi:hypothetical protein